MLLVLFVVAGVGVVVVVDAVVGVAGGWVLLSSLGRDVDCVAVDAIVVVAVVFGGVATVLSLSVLLLPLVVVVAGDVVGAVLLSLLLLCAVHRFLVCVVFIFFYLLFFSLYVPEGFVGRFGPVCSARTQLKRRSGGPYYDSDDATNMTRCCIR